MNISAVEAVVLRKSHNDSEKDWAKQMADIYQARPLQSNAEEFYSFVCDVFHAGEISGKREERARRKAAQA